MTRKISLAGRTLVALSALPLLAWLPNASAEGLTSPLFHGTVLTTINGKTYGKGILTPDALQTCIIEANKLEMLDREIKEAKDVAADRQVSPEDESFRQQDAQLKSENAALSLRDANLQAEARKLNRRDKAASAAYETKFLALDRDWTAYQERRLDLDNRVRNKPVMPGLTAKVSDYNSRLGAFNDGCAGQNYYQDDYAAARASIK